MKRQYTLSFSTVLATVIIVLGYEADIERLNVTIRDREQLLNENNLNDEEVKQLVLDAGTRYLSNLFLKKLREGECIMIVTYMPSFNLF
jgi:hypothetical protein